MMTGGPAAPSAGVAGYAGAGAYASEDPYAGGASMSSYSSASQDQKQGSQDRNYLDALGLPNDGGRLSWPVGLRIVPPANEINPVREQVEVAALLAGRELVRGDKADRRILDQATRDVRWLRWLVMDSEGKVPYQSIEQSVQFLNKVDKGLKLAKDAEAPAYPK
jgi:hypothetical protein